MFWSVVVFAFKAGEVAVAVGGWVVFFLAFGNNALLRLLNISFLLLFGQVVVFIFMTTESDNVMSFKTFSDQSRY